MNNIGEYMYVVIMRHQGHGKGGGGLRGELACPDPFEKKYLP